MSQIVAEALCKTYQVHENASGLKGWLCRKTKTVHALRDISFRIEQGEMIGYIGPNGAGKSTTVKILSGILVPDSGQCSVAGLVPWEDRVAHVSHIGVVFGQRTQLWWDLPVAESFDLLLTDLMMPKTNGIELLRQALSIDSNLVGILMTGHGAIETAVEAMKSGAYDYVLKPFNLTVILPVLERSLATRTLRLENGRLLNRLTHPLSDEAAAARA